MVTDTGRSPSGRATHERSRVAPSPPTVSVPNALDEMAAKFRDEYRNTLLDKLDTMWLDGRERGFLDATELNALNAAVGELALEWGRQGWWRRPAQAIEAGTAATTKIDAVHESAVGNADVPKDSGPKEVA